MLVQRRLPLLARPPDRLDPHAHPDVLGRAVEDQVQERDVRAVEQYVRGDVGRLDPLPLERHVDDAEGGHDAAVGQLHLLLGGHAVDRAGAARRDVDLAADRAALADEPALLRARAGRPSPAARRSAAPAVRSGWSSSHRLERRRACGDAASPSGRSRSRRCRGCARPARRPTGRAPACRSTLPGGVDVDGVQHRSVGAVELDQRPGERLVERLARHRLGRPASRLHHPPSSATSTKSVSAAPVPGSYSSGGTYDPAVAAARTDDRAAGQPGHEPAEGGAERAGVVEAQLDGRAQRLDNAHSRSETRSRIGDKTVGSLAGRHRLAEELIHVLDLRR